MSTHSPSIALAPKAPKLGADARTRLATVGLAVFLAAAAGAIGTATSWTLIVAALLAISTIAFGVARPWLFLLVFLGARPLFDQYSSSHVNVGIGALNVDGAVGLMVLAVVFLLCLAKRRITVPYSAKPFGAVIAVSALLTVYAYSKLGSTVGTKAIAELVRLAALLAVYLLATNVAATPERVRRLFLVVALSGIVPAVVAIGAVVSGNAPVAVGLDITRAFGTFSGPTAFGEFLALPAMILVLAPREMMPRGLRLAVLGVVIVALVMSYGRAAYAELLIAIFVVEHRRLSRTLLVVAVVAIAITIAVPSVQQRVLPSSSTASGAATTVAPSGYSSFSWRLNNWGLLLGQWEKSPFLGYGLESTTTVNPERGYSGPALVGSGFAAHNTFIRALVEGGIVGLGVWILFCISLLRGARSASRDTWELSRYANMLWGMWVGVIVVGLTSDDIFGATALMFALLALTGAVQGAHKAHREQQRTADAALPDQLVPGEASLV